MRYATWELYWQPDARFGLGPEATIAERGGKAEGAFYTADTIYSPIVGYLHDDIALSNLDEWNVTEITSEQALTLAKAITPDATLDAEGRIIFPMPDVNG